VNDEFALSSGSARALDALVEAGFDVAKVAPELRAEAERAARLVGMLDGPALRADPALTDVIMARIALSEELPAEMSAADHAALESLVMHGFEPSRVPGSLRERAERHRALADLVCAARVAPADELADGRADSLVDRTLAAVQREIDAEEDRFDFESRRAVFSGMRLADILSVAAMLLIATAVVWPLVTSLRESQQRALCFGRIGTMAGAFGTYASGAADALPVAAGSVAEGVWWDVGAEGRSNSANLFKLAPEGYLAVEDMACPGNDGARTAEAAPGERDWHEFDEVSFSYQHVDIASSRAWEAPRRFVVLADRSPITVLNKRGEVAPAEANSLNHGQRGQRVLMSDGSAEWLRSPVLPDGDNIWLPRVVEVMLHNMGAGKPLLEGLERPGSSADSMLVP
jgi:hypothetical protein